MDPEQTLRDLLDRIQDGEGLAASDSARELSFWLLGGGALPDVRLIVADWLDRGEQRSEYADRGCGDDGLDELQHRLSFKDDGSLT